jgi:hypothetical protein
MAGVPLEVLTDEFTISYTPSGTMYAWLRERAGEMAGDRHSLLALGDPLFPEAPTTNPPRHDPPPHGVLVAHVLRDSNADRNGLQDGDVLLSYDGRPLAGPEALGPAIAGSAEESGKRIALGVWRDGDTLDVEVDPGKLGLRPAKQPAPAALSTMNRLDNALRDSRGATYEALPHTRREVEAIGRLFGGEQTEAKPLVLLGAEATEQRLQGLAAANKLKEYRYLHLATHGEMDDRLAMRSALILAQHRLPDSFEQVLSGEEIFDGRLTGDQVIRTWRLDAELVTLSGCRTALGKEAGGEGYLGFSQALFAAGARSLLLSLWQVEDRATMLLMQRFYENLLGRFSMPRQVAGRKYAPGTALPKAEALREAKQWLRGLTAAEAATLLSPSPAQVGDPTARPFAAPRYWAAFILLGE